MANTGSKSSGSSWQHLYGRRWRKAAEAHKRANPLCVMCQQEGRVTPAQVTDHITPHKGDEVLFWDRGNWQSLCKWHHDSHKQRTERGSAQLRTVGIDGYPLGD